MWTSRVARDLIAWVGAVLFSVSPAWADDPTPEQSRFFEKQVRPLLVEQCTKCHGEAKQKGGLRLDSLDALLHGGDSGPAVVPGKPGESLIIEAVKHDGLAMPPTGKLADEKIEVLTRWVEQGAPWPSGGHATTKSSTPLRGDLTDEDRAYWFFQPLQTGAVPRTAPDEWSRNPIDAYVLKKLRAEGLRPAPEADRRALIRRLSFDLIGLPPTPEEIEEFDGDTSPGAYERLVERLLESPRYGERWARHWLDLVRYAESDGFRADGYRPNAWPYRDYVIRSFNQDKPYDRFLLEQLAGDELAPDDPEMRVATGYYRLGTYEHNQRDVPSQRANILNDITDVTGEVVLGLSFGCARCHDHKFDPILQEDYYRLQAFFTPMLWRDDLPNATAAEAADYQVGLAAWRFATEGLRERIAELERPARAKSAKGVIEKFPPATQSVLTRPESELSPYERQIAYYAARQYESEGAKVETLLKGEAKTEWTALREELAGYDRLKPPAPPIAFTTTDVGRTAPPNVIPGDRQAREIAPGLLAVLTGELARLPEIEPLPNSTGRRTALARWLTQPDNPMTARVIVNRVWQYHFGRGLVATSSDYGRLGEAPSHPELLDWLAVEFIQRGWSFKALHRLIVTSSTYRQSARVAGSQIALRKDPENRWLWRMNTRRLDAEMVRDAVLATSGELMTCVGGGPAVETDRPQRTIYTKVTRNTRDELLDVFDAPDASLSTALRNTTTTPTQSLYLLNGPWLLKRAKAFARDVESAAGSTSRRIDLAFERAYGRPPQTSERDAAEAFLQEESNLADFCHVLLNSNEFLYVD